MGAPHTRAHSTETACVDAKMTDYVVRLRSNQIDRHAEQSARRCCVIATAESRGQKQAGVRTSRATMLS